MELQISLISFLNRHHHTTANASMATNNTTKTTHNNCHIITHTTTYYHTPTQPNTTKHHQTQHPFPAQIQAHFIPSGTRLAQLYQDSCFLHAANVHQHAQHVGLNTRARCLVFVLLTGTSHPHWLKSSLHLHPHAIHVWLSLILFDLSFYFHPHFFVFYFPSSPCTPTTLTPWKITCATPRRGATTPTTSPSPSQVMSPTTRSPTSSSTPRVPSPTLLRHWTRTWMTLRSASHSLKYTENTPITAVRKVYLSVRRQCLSRPIERGNLWKRETSISFVLVSETCTVLTISFLQSLKLKEWSIERGNPWKKSLDC